MGWCQPIVVQHIRQQQIVDVTSVARDIDDLMGLGEFFDPGYAIDVDAVVQVVPEPGQQGVKETDDAVGLIGGYLTSVAQRLFSTSVSSTLALRASCSIAVRNSGLASIVSMRVRRCDRSGPMMAWRSLLK